MLRNICLASLLKQSYENWQAIIIGKDEDIIVENNEHFYLISEDGTKEEKLQIATEYIVDNNIPGDYIIRLDDDDIINPRITKKVSELDFDLYVDKHQWFWHYYSGSVSSRVWHWFPNTCIHKREHALAVWGVYAKGEFRKYKEQALLIENDHSKLHPYYKDKKTLFAERADPVYLRTITSTSITAKNSNDHEAYFKRFGLWGKNHLKDFQFLNQLGEKDFSSLPHYTIKEIALQRYYDLKSSMMYIKHVL